MTTPDPNTMTLVQTLATEKAAAQAISDAYTTFKGAVTDALGTLPTEPAYKPQVRDIGAGVLANLSYQLGTQLPALIASYDPPAPVTAPTA